MAKKLYEDAIMRGTIVPEPGYSHSQPTHNPMGVSLPGAAAAARAQQAAAPRAQLQPHQLLGASMQRDDNAQDDDGFQHAGGGGGHNHHRASGGFQGLSGLAGLRAAMGGGFGGSAPLQPSGQHPVPRASAPPATAAVGSSRPTGDSCHGGTTRSLLNCQSLDISAPACSIALASVSCISCQSWPWASEIHAFLCWHFAC